MSIVEETKARRLRLTRASNGMLMTPEEFDAVTCYDRRFSYDLVHGVVIVSPPPSESERDPNEELGHLLRNYRDDHPNGSALDKTLSEQYINVPDGRRRADRVIWAGLGRVPNPRKDVATIAVEFVSKRKRDRTRDYEEKQRAYMAIRIAEYWIINRFDRTMTVFRAGAAAVEAPIVIKEHETYRTPLLPGFELPLDSLLKVADDWTVPKAPRELDRAEAVDSDVPETVLRKR